ncbi:MAG: hypothetical protein IPJ65_04560 [Archangiaceae bacterium]|nr:hypothetical protein [Archangiaceae bacterium]
MVSRCMLAAVLPWLVACAAPLAQRAPEANGLEPSDPAAEPAPLTAGLHRVLRSPHGQVHLFVPRGYDPTTAGIVLYVHGYYTDVEAACRSHRLAAQFAASRRNALFVVPEAPRGDGDPVQFRDLDDLLDTVEREGGVTLPDGPVVAVAHSGGYRTVEAWLQSPRLDTVVLLDALYGADAAWRSWLEEGGNHPWALLLVGHHTTPNVQRFAEAYPDAPLLDGLAAAAALEPRGEQRVVAVRSPLGHMELVTARRAIPAVLALTGLAPLAPLAAP